MLPEKFKERMKDLLKDGYEDFLASMEEDEPVRAFRINRIKASCAEDVAERLGREKIPYEEHGYVLKDGFPVGKSAAHHSGAIYVQDPGAMVTLAAIDIPAGAAVADLCAAPGGKSSKLAEYIGEDGFLLANEYVPKRAKLLVGNLERLGVRNAVVTSLDTGELAKLFDGVFDLVVVDAPCSGEGMFRKNAEAIAEWSEENVRASGERQRTILENAASMVAPGGLLLYSTCTFSTEENEENVIDFLYRHEDFALSPVNARILPYTSAAIDTDGRHPKIALAARRFYPHIAKGEGQFVALLKRQSSDRKPRGFLYKESARSLNKEEALAVRRFFEDTLTEIPTGRLVKQGENVVLISHGCPIPPRSVFLSGVLVGEIRKGILFPAHHFFSVYGLLFKNILRLREGDPLLEKYLRGEELATDGTLRGWCAVLADGVPLGGGKASGSVLKNHYPKGLRN